MANTKSAQKQILQAEKRHQCNVARKSSIKTAVKKVLTALEAGKTKDEVQVLFNDAQAQCARAKGKHTLHANTAARKVSRLALRVQSHFATATAK
ncbi:MAG: 30S ribosomal protein S20 [Candidatus Dependentiae bacterium]|nr:30S ribosomal protein S20 [Candidatus Dependentiae bacterium]